VVVGGEPGVSNYTIAIDTGGTFTDLVLADEQSIIGLYKAPTTPADLVLGITAAIEQAAASQGLSTAALLGQTSTFVYSTTHSTNAVLEGKVARTAFLTTRGHPDILTYKEGGKDQVHNWSMAFPKPYVPRRLTFEITGRVLADGTIAVPLDEDEVRAVLERLRDLEVEAIGVCLLWSPVNPAHEIRIGKLIDELLPGVVCSLKPLMRRHLQDMDARLRALGFRGEPLMVTHVSGGVMRLAQMLERPLQTIDSGPALAPVAGSVFERAEFASPGANVLVVDTGGTSFDASLIHGGQVAYTREKWFGHRWYGHMTGLPAVDTRSIGAGGGSIARVDAAGMIHVGPESAGAEPGPAAYGRGGTEPTVTDAAVVLGYIDPDDFLGGHMRLDAKAARRAVASRLAEPLGIGVEQAAASVLAIVSESMRGLLTDLTVAQGRDARECLMVAGGGAAGLNIVHIAREAGIRTLIVPKLAAGLSAVGGLYSDIMAVFSRGFLTNTTKFDSAGVNATLAGIDNEIEDFFRQIEHPGARSKRFLCEARYEQEMWEIEVELGAMPAFDAMRDLPVLRQRFDVKHLDTFATQQQGAPIEVVSWRGEARIARHKPALTRPGPVEAGDSLPESRRHAWFGDRTLDTPVYRGATLAAGRRISGPAILSEETTTLVLIPGSSAQVRKSHYLIDVGEG
jgi:N-methylhydantoinase A